MPDQLRHLSRSKRTTRLFASVLFVLAAACHDEITGPRESGLEPGPRVVAQSVGSGLGTPASELPMSEVIAAIADSRTGQYITNIGYYGEALRVPPANQVAVVGTPDTGFATSSPPYLVISTGDARDPRLDGGWNFRRVTYAPAGSGDMVSVFIVLTVPPGAMALEVDFRFFTADSVHRFPPYSFADQMDLHFYSQHGYFLSRFWGGLEGLVECPSGPPGVRCTTGFVWFPNGMRRLGADVRSLAGTTVWLGATVADMGRDSLGQSGVAIDNLRFILANEPPVANAGGPYVSDEGASVALNGTASSDPENGVLTYAWDLDGDGEFDDATGAQVSRSYADNGSYPVSLRVTDPDGASAVGATMVTVRNVAPVASISAARLVHPVLGSASVAIEAAFTDPGADTHTASVDCDNGEPVVSLGSVSAPLIYACTYATPHFGDRTVRVTVTDDDGGVGTQAHTVSIRFVWSGFFRPVANAPAVNAPAAGSALPLKFSLGGDQGPAVLAPGFPRFEQEPCDAGDGAPMPAVAPLHGGLLKYDSLGDQYNFVWKTDKAWEGNCGRFVLRLVDGTDHYVRLRFRDRKG